MRKTAFSVFFLFTCLYLQGYAFAYDNGDWQVWNNDCVETKLTDAIKAKVDQEFRVGDNMSELYYIHTEGILSYKVTEGLDLGVGYRHIFEKKNRKWKEEYRPEFEGELSWKWQTLKFKDRSRLELRVREKTDNKWRYRNKFSAELPLKWKDMTVSPYVADEIFVDFYGQKVNRNRLYEGIKFTPFRNLQLEAYYLWEANKIKTGKWSNVNAVGANVKVVF